MILYLLCIVVEYEVLVQCTGTIIVPFIAMSTIVYSTKYGLGTPGRLPFGGAPALTRPVQWADCTSVGPVTAPGGELHPRRHHGVQRAACICWAYSKPPSGALKQCSALCPVAVQGTSWAASNKHWHTRRLRRHSCRCRGASC